MAEGGESPSQFYAKVGGKVRKNSFVFMLYFCG